MKFGFKYLIAMRDTKGRCRVGFVKADNAKQAKAIASKTWPEYFINLVKPSFSLKSPLTF